MLDKSVRNQLAKKLAERLVAPRIASASLSGMADCYKIKLRSAGYRLVYRVEDLDGWLDANRRRSTSDKPQSQ